MQELSNYFLTHESALRLSVFLGVFVVLALLELLTPRRRQSHSKPLRWFSNLGLSLVNSLTLRLLLPMSAVTLAFWLAGQKFGLLHWLHVPSEINVLFTLIFLDFAIYLQHVATHKFAWLWRLHRMHHSDLELDVSSGIRFHPFEIALSMGYKIALITLFGLHPVGVFLFEVLLNALALFTHSNIHLPHRVDKVLRLFIVTPDMHRVHHSIERHEHDMNYGFNLSLWDRLFKTYKEQPDLGQHGMKLGLKQFPNEGDLRLDKLLVQPFKSKE